MPRFAQVLSVLACTSLFWQQIDASSKCGVTIGEKHGPQEALAEKRSVNVDHLPATCDESAAIDVQLPNGKVLTFEKDHRIRRLQSLHNQHDHHFRGQAGRNTFEYIRSSVDKSKIVGTIRDFDEHKIYQVKVNAQGEEIVRIIEEKNFLPEDEPIIKERQHRRAAEVPKKKTMMMENNKTLRGSSLGLTFDAQVASALEAKKQEHGRDLQARSTIDVMVLWTVNAECDSVDGRNDGDTCTPNGTTERLMRDLIDLAVAETNTALDNSNVNAELRLVHAYRESSWTEQGMSAALNALTEPADGKMDDAHKYRAQYGADMVAILTDDEDYCGLAWGGPGKDSMFSVTQWDCATGYYTFGHELGHNWGFEHDRDNGGDCEDPNGCVNYGFRDTVNEFRTIMAYSCDDICDDVGIDCNCDTRVQVFSNNGVYSFQGNPTGNAETDNASVISSNRVEVAGYFDQPAQCNGYQGLVTFELATDNYPGETSWEITDSNGSTVATGGSYGWADNDRYKDYVFLCEGDYSFTINDSAGDGICCGQYGDGSYSLLVDGETVKTGGVFGGSETTAFSIAGEGGPATTTSTSTTSTTTTTTSTTTTTTTEEECVNFVFDLKTDDYPSETTWEITKNGQVVASGGPYDNGDSDYFEELCLDDGSYSFTIDDSANDGICCGYGIGDYSLVVEGVTIVDGQGEFDSSETTSFTIGGGAPPTTTTSTSTNPTTTSTTTSSTTTEEATQCPNGSNFVFDLLTDNYPGETTWEITKDGQVVASGGPYSNGDSDYFEEFCLEDGSYTFTLYDEADDGICCGQYGDGDYSLIVEGVAIVNGQGQFGSSESTPFTIGGDTTPPTTTTSTTTSTTTTTTTTTDDCPGGSMFELNMELDSYPEETSWAIYESGNMNTPIKSGGNYQGVQFFKENLTPIVEEFCLDNGSYVFKIFDSYGDGICCGASGDGSYSIAIDGVALGAFDPEFGAVNEVPLTIG